MIRVVYIARYRNAAMEHKIDLLAAEPDMRVCLVRPASWQDEYGRILLPVQPNKPYTTLAVPLVGKNNDPHRVLYRTLTFSLRTVKPDIIHVEEEPDSLAALQIALVRRIFAPRAKLLLHTWQNVNRTKRRLVHWVTQTTLNQADAILCANQAAVAVLAQMGYRRLTAVIPPSGVDLSVFYPRKPHAASKPFTVLYLGRFVPEKGLDTLLEAIQRVGPTVRLRLIGDGPSRADLEAQARAMGIADRVELAAALPLDRVPDALAAANVLVLPSRSTAVWQEQFGRVLIEAMACKVPLIGSDSGAIPEVIGNAGLIFPEGNVEALTACLDRLIASSDLRSELAERGYHRVRVHFSQEVIAAQTAIFYRTMVP